jgi:hypothetical protein
MPALFLLKQKPMYPAVSAVAAFFLRMGQSRGWRTMKKQRGE